MSSFDEFFTLKDETQKKKKPSITKTPASATPRPRTPRTPQIDLEKISNTFSQVLDEKLQRLTKTIENQAIPSQVQPSEIMKVGIIHTFNRENLIQFIGRRGKRGTKLCELRDYFFGSATTGKIDIEVQKLRKEGLIQKNRSGWMSLRKKRSE